MSLGFRGGVLLTLGGRGVGLAVGLLSSVVTARWLGPEGRGLLATLSVVTGLALQFGNPGLHTGNVYFVSRRKERAPAVLGNTLAASWGAGLLCALLVAGVSAALPGALPGIPRPLLLLTAAVLPFQFMIVLYQNTLLGLHEVWAFNAIEVGNKVVTFLLLAAWLVVWGGGAGGVVVLFAIMAVACAAASIAACARAVPFRPSFDGALFSEMLRYGGRVYLACLLSFLVIRSDMLLVNLLRGTAEAGVYSIAAQIADTILLLPVTVGMLLLPRVARDAERDAGGSGAGAARALGQETTARVLRHTALLLTGLCLGAALLAGPVIGALYGERFRGAVAATWWLLPGVWALGLNGVLMNHFAGRGMPSITAWAPLAGFAANVALNLAVVPRYGIAGAAATSSAAYLLMLALSLAAFLREGGVGVRSSLVVRADEVRGLLGLQEP